MLSPLPPHKGCLSTTATFFCPQGIHRGKESTVIATTNQKKLIGFTFASDWLREFSEPITEQSKAKLIQSRIIFYTQMKIWLCIL